MDRQDAPPPDQQASIYNIPNLLCAIRLFGSPVLVGLAIAQWQQAFVVLMVFLLATDWIDGKLAVWWRQQTTFGARLDSIADAALYSTILFGLVWLKGEEVAREYLWIGAALASYALTSLVGLAKFRRLPSYHTRAAKTSWLLVSVAAISLFAGWSIWPLRVAAAAVMVTNLEATAITFVLSECHVDVLSLWHAWRIRRDSSAR